MTCGAFCLASVIKATDHSVWKPCARGTHDGGNHFWIEPSDHGESDREREVYVWRDATSMKPQRMTLWAFVGEMKPV